MAQLPANSDKYQALLAATPDAIITISEAGLIQSLNPAAVKLFEYKQEQLIGQNISTLMPEPWASEHDNYLKNYCATGQKKIIGKGRDVKGLKSDGSTFPMRLSVCEYEVDGLRYFTGIVHDITARKQSEAALFQAQKMESIGQLTSGIAHDFNNLLTVIIGNLELLDARTKDQKQQAFIKDALVSAEIGADMIERLLAFSRKSFLAPQEVDINNLVSSLERILGRTLGKDTELVTHLGEDLPKIVADPNQIENAVLNMALNARDAMPSGGKLVIETKVVFVDEDYANSEPDFTAGNYIVICVTDTGTGMPDSVLNHVFEPFFSTKKPGEGTGLGMSMVYGFAKQSGGHITIYSELELGTTVNFYLPVLDNVAVKNMNIPDLSKTNIPQGKGELILVVEDDEKIRDVTVKRLKNLNYKTISAENGDQAIKLLAENDRFDLVITDLVMPGETSGYDLVEHIHLHYPELPLIMTSGYAEDKTHEQRLAASHVNLIRKPFINRDLARLVRATIDFHAKLD